MLDFLCNTLKHAILGRIKMDHTDHITDGVTRTNQITFLAAKITAPSCIFQIELGILARVTKKIERLTVS